MNYMSSNNYRLCTLSLICINFKNCHLFNKYFYD